MMSYPENPILVVVDVTPSGDAASSTAGLIGAASTIGAPVALIVGGTQAATDAAAAAGAQVVLTAEGDAAALTVPIVDALQTAFERVQPDAVLLSNSIAGRDVAGRFAVRARLALLVDAVGVSRDDVCSTASIGPADAATASDAATARSSTAGAATASARASTAPCLTVTTGAPNVGAESVR